MLLLSVKELGFIPIIKTFDTKLVLDVVNYLRCLFFENNCLEGFINKPLINLEVLSPLPSIALIFSISRKVVLIK